MLLGLRNIIIKKSSEYNSDCDKNFESVQLETTPLLKVLIGPYIQFPKMNIIPLVVKTIEMESL